MTTQKLGWSGIILSVIGIVLVIVGILWITVIFPMLAQVPTDLAKTIYFDGSLTVPNEATGAMVTFPIEQILVQNANGTQDGAVFIHETYTMKNAVTGDEVTANYIEQTLAVDRHTLKIVTNIDEQHRSGYWSPPRGLGDGDSFDLWDPGPHKAVVTKYVKDDTFRGMKVVIFKADEQNMSLGTNPQTQLPMLMDTTINLTIDPKTGVVVDEDALTTISMDMGGQKAPVMITYVRFAERTIVDLVDTAKDNQSMLFWFQSLLPWLLIGIGAVLLIIGAGLMIRKQRTA